MARSASKIRFSATLFRPKAEGAAAPWTFLRLPIEASRQLPTRSMISVEGRLAGTPFQLTLEPDGEGGHWLKVPAELRQAAGVEPGEEIELEIAPLAHELEPELPADFRAALEADPAALATWTTTTTVARRDWVQWMTSAKKPETRLRRVANACAMLASGKKRVCCFDRSGMYSNSLSCPLPDLETEN